MRRALAFVSVFGAACICSPEDVCSVDRGNWHFLHSASAEWTDVRVGRRYACGLRNDGTVHCIGNAPGAISGNGYVGVAVAEYWLCGLRQNGTVRCSRGLNDIGIEEPFTDLAIGNAHACALT